VRGRPEIGPQLALDSEFAGLLRPAQPASADSSGHGAPKAGGPGRAHRSRRARRLRSAGVRDFTTGRRAGGRAPGRERAGVIAPKQRAGIAWDFAELCGDGCGSVGTGRWSPSSSPARHENI